VRISEALSGLKLLGIETAPFIYFTEKRPIYVDKVRAIFQFWIAHDLILFSSTISLAECLVKPLRDKDTALVAAYSELFESTEGLHMISVDITIARRAAELRALYNLKTPDALHVATALEANCDAFLTNDTDIKRVSELRVLVLDELEIDPPPEEPMS
jgi:predicted nucleic acid-binding protein